MSECGETVKCTGCAFLATKSPTEPIYLETTSQDRENLVKDEAKKPRSDKIHKYVCFVMAQDLTGLYGVEVFNVSDNALPKVVVSEARKCKKFYPYKVGYTPKEVAEQLYRDEMIILAKKQIEDAAIRGEEQRIADRAFEAEVRKEQNTFHTNASVKTAKNNLNNIIISVAVPVLYSMVLGALGLAAIQCNNTKVNQPTSSPTQQATSAK